MGPTNQLLTKSDYTRHSVDRVVTGEQDPILRKYNLELLLAGTVCIRLLGRDWWKRAENEVKSALQGTPLEKPRSHPLSKFYGSSVSGWLLLIAFASDLLDCADKLEVTNLKEKIKELRTDSFFRTWFEIRTAAQLIRKGMAVSFVPSSDVEKRPDLSVKYSANDIEIECKMRKELDPEEKIPEIYEKKMRVRIGSVESLIIEASKKFGTRRGQNMIAVGVDLVEGSAGDREVGILKSRAETFLDYNRFISGIIFWRLAFRWNQKTDAPGWINDFMCITNPDSDFPVGTDFVNALKDATTGNRESLGETLSLYALSH